LTYEEPRIFLQALTQAEAPSAGAKTQLLRAIQALSQSIARERLSADEWRRIWARLFSKRESSKVESRFAISTEGPTPELAGDLPANADGMYMISGICGIQGDGMGGSLLIHGTFRKAGNTLARVRSDRLLAQLDPALVGVNAYFDVRQNRIALIVAGKALNALSWDNHVTLYPPK
jgi:hypothetical protein